MPQLILEYSHDIIEKENLFELFQRCHQLLTTTLPTELSSCKSRAYASENYSVGDGNPMNAFVHVSLKVLAGRTPATMQQVGQQMMDILTQHFAESIKKLNLQLSLELSELSNHYFKK